MNTLPAVEISSAAPGVVQAPVNVEAPAVVLSDEQAAAVRGYASLAVKSEAAYCAWRAARERRNTRAIGAARKEYDYYEHRKDSALWVVSMMGRPVLQAAYDAAEVAIKAAKSARAAAPAPAAPGAGSNIPAGDELSGGPVGLWVYGNTYPVRGAIRACGGTWDRGRQAWFLAGVIEVPALAQYPGLKFAVSGIASPAVQAPAGQAVQQ